MIPLLTTLLSSMLFMSPASTEHMDVAEWSPSCEPEASSVEEAVPAATCHTEYGACQHRPVCGLDVPEDPFGQTVRQVCCAGGSCWTASSAIVCGCLY